MEEINKNNEIKNEEVIKKNGRNTTLNLFEFIAACLIIFIHILFPEPFGSIVTGLAKFGVPLFFTVSGFYLIKPNMDKECLRKKLKVRIFRVSKLLIFSFVIYFILDMITSVFGSTLEGIVEILKSTFSWKSIFFLLVFNISLVQNVNWFMIALIYSYIYIYIFADLFLHKDWVKYLLSILLLFWIAFRMIVTYFNVSLFGVFLSESYLYLNWFANGLLFISFGMMLAKYKDKLVNIPYKVLISLLIICIIIQPLEYYILTYKLNYVISYFIGNILCVFTIIALSIKNPNILNNSKFINQKGNYTMFIYIFHPAIITIVKFIVNKAGLESNALMQWTLPIIVLIFAVISAMIFNKILCTIKNSRSSGKVKDKMVEEKLEAEESKDDIDNLESNM